MKAIVAEAAAAEARITALPRWTSRSSARSRARAAPPRAATSRMIRSARVKPAARAAKLHAAAVIEVAKAAARAVAVKAQADAAKAAAVVARAAAVVARAAATADV